MSGEAGPFETTHLFKGIVSNAKMIPPRQQVEMAQKFLELPGSKGGNFPRMVYAASETTPQRVQEGMLAIVRQFTTDSRVMVRVEEFWQMRVRLTASMPKGIWGATKGQLEKLPGVASAELCKPHYNLVVVRFSSQPPMAFQQQVRDLLAWR